MNGRVDAERLGKWVNALDLVEVHGGNVDFEGDEEGREDMGEQMGGFA